MDIIIKKGKLRIVAGILLLQSCFVLTACSNVNKDTTINTEYIDEKLTNDKDIISYFNEELATIEEILKDKENGYEQKVKEKIIILIDFLFYNSEINGVTLNQLSVDAKNKLINILFDLDEMIEKEIPNYKNQISNEYKIALDIIKNQIEKTDKYLTENIGNYDQIKETFDATVDSTKNQFNEFKDASNELINDGKSKIKNYYEQFKNDVKNN